jgi:hypothetical protein
MPDTILGDTFTFSVLGERLLIGAWIGFECTFTSDTGLTVTCSVLSNEDYSITVSHVPDAFFSLPVTWKLSVPAKWNTPEDYAYGFDLLKTGDGDLSFGFDNDFILLHGMRNFEQALDVKLNTESQSLPMHPWFGMLKNVGQRGDNATIVGVVTSFMRTLASDSRVAAVEGVKVGIDKDVLVIQAGIRSKLDNTVTVVGGSF